MASVLVSRRQELADEVQDLSNRVSMKGFAETPWSVLGECFPRGREGWTDAGLAPVLQRLAELHA